MQRENQKEYLYKEQLSGGTRTNARFHSFCREHTFQGTQDIEQVCFFLMAGIALSVRIQNKA